MRRKFAELAFITQPKRAKAAIGLQRQGYGGLLGHCRMSAAEGCVYCSGDLTEDYGSGYYVCTQCAAVQPERVVETGKEWRDFGDENTQAVDRSRAQEVDEFNTLSSTIPEGSRLSKFAKVSSCHSKSEAYLKGAYAKINELADSLQLQQLIKEEAKDVLRQIERQRDETAKLPPRKDAYIVAVLLLASKSKLGGRTLKELSARSRIPEKDVRNYYKALLRHPAVVAMLRDNSSVTEQTQGLAEVFGRKLQLPHSVVYDARAVAEVACAIMEGRKPQSIAGAAILLVTWLYQCRLDEQALENISGISLSTLRELRKELEQNMDKLPSKLFSAQSTQRASFSFPLYSPPAGHPLSPVYSVPKGSRSPSPPMEEFSSDSTDSPVSPSISSTSFEAEHFDDWHTLR